MRTARAFTLVEILIVVVLLGVLAAIVIPAVASSGNEARGSTLATNLKLLRRFVPIYKAQHLEVRPGYPNGDASAAPTEEAFVDQATLATNASGQTAAPGTAGFNRGPYMAKIPKNPFNELNSVQILADGEAFPAAADDSHGWVYKPSTGELRADCTGANSSGKSYYADY